MTRQRLRVCYFGTYRGEYSRNQIMMAGLRRAEVDVLECHTPLWNGIEDRVRAAGGAWASPRFVRRALLAYGELLRQYRSVGRYDAMMIGYPGQFDVYLARLLTRLRHKPLVWDIFMSIYLIALERGLDRRVNPTVWGLRRVEGLACQLPDLLIIDTDDYVRWFAQTHRVRPDRFRLTPTGADDRVFTPSPPRPSDGQLRVVYYGSFIPNHGVACIVEAARLLADDETIQFEFIGAGPDRNEALDLARRYALSNVTFTDWLETSELVSRASRADVCLGAFGTTPQSLMTVQNKIYEGLAMARPVITGDSPAVRAALTHRHHVYLVERASPAALAGAIRTLRGDPALRAHLAEAGHRLFREHFTVEAIGRRTRAHIESVLPA